MLSLASVRGRKWSFAGSFATIVLGVTILSMTLLVFAGAQPQVPQRFSHASVIVHAPLTHNDFSTDLRPWTAAAAAALTERLSAVAGVRQAVADRSFYAQLVGGPTEALGWSSSLLAGESLVDGRAPSAQGEIAVGGGTALGKELEMLTATGPVRVKVVGVVSGEGMYVSDAWAATLSPGVKAIGLVTDGPVDLSGVPLDGGVVATGDDRAILEPEAVGRIRYLGAQLLVAMAGLGLFVTVFVVSSTLALAASQRRREIGLLRTIGATDRQVRRLILGEALLLGVLGAAVGAVLGSALAPILARLLFHWGLEPHAEITLTAWPVVTAWLIGVAVAVLGAWSASRRAARVGPLEALREAAVERRLSKVRLGFGGLALALAGWLASATASSTSEHRTSNALLTACVLIVAATLLAPLAIRPLVRVATLLLRGPAGPVVRGEMLNAQRRSASLVAPVIATVGFTVMLTGMVTTMLGAYPAERAAELKGLTVVVPQDGVPGLSDAAVATAAGGDAYLSARVAVGDRLLEVAGASSVPAGSIAIDEHDAGSTVAVTFADGETVSLRVIGPSTSIEDAEIPRELVREHDSSALTREVIGGVAAGPGAKVLDANSYAIGLAARESRLLWLFATVLIGLSVGYTWLAVLNTMGMATSGRRRDFAVLRTAGATTRQVFGFVLSEAVLIVGAGAVLGLAVTVPPLLAMAHGIEEETGLPVPLELHWPSVVTVVVACLCAASLGTILNLRAKIPDVARQ